MHKAEHAVGRYIRATPLPVLVGVIVLLSLWSRFDSWEGAILPVTENAQIVDVDRDEAARTTAITVEFEKLRPCSFVSVGWYWVDESGTTHRVPFLESAASGPGNQLTRPLGQQSTTHKLDTLMPVERLRALVWHDCHPGWHTVTQFYP